MKQQYELLRKNNDPLKSLIGRSYNQKSKFEAEKILTEIHSIATLRTISKMALCYVTDKDEIKGVGGSTLLKNKKTGEVVSNLILNNFGLFLAAMFKPEITSNVAASLLDTVGGTDIVNLYGGTLFNNNNFAGMSIQVGQGITPPARTDFVIETVFGTAPESARVVLTGNPVYSTSSFNFKCLSSFNAGGVGTISESMLLARWDDSLSASGIYALFHDAISPAVSFVIGQSIAVEYTVQI